MVARARTLVPISESETKLTYQVPGFSQHRRCVIARGPSPGPPRTPPAFGGTPSGFEIAPLRASGAPPVGWPRRGRLRRSEGPSRASEGRLRAWEGPRRSGGLRVSLRSLPGRLPGLRCSSRRDLRRSRFRCPLGFPFSLSPLLYLHSINRHPRCQAPAVCPSPHFQAPYGTVAYPKVTFADVAVSYTYEAVSYLAVTYHQVTSASVTYHGVTYTYVAVTYGYVGKSSPFFITKRPLFDFRGQVSATKRIIFEFRGSKKKEIRTAVGGGHPSEAHTTQRGGRRRHPLRVTRIDSEAISAPDPNDPTGAALKGPQRATS